MFSLHETNPLLQRELLGRSRRVAFVASFTVGLMFLLFVAGVTWQVTSSQNRVSGAVNSEAGINIFESVVIAIAILVPILVPGMAAFTISSERERHNYAAITLSFVSKRQFLLGKLAAVLAPAMLLICAAMPILWVGYALGGVSFATVIRAVVALVLITTLFAAIGIMASAVVKTTPSAMLLVYSIVVGVVLIAPGIAGALAASSKSVGWAIGAAHPLAFVASLAYAGANTDADKPLSALARKSDVIPGLIPGWGYHLMFYVFVVFGCLWVAATRLGNPADSER